MQKEREETAVRETAPAITETTIKLTASLVGVDFITAKTSAIQYSGIGRAVNQRSDKECYVSMAPYPGRSEASTEKVYSSPLTENVPSLEKE